MIKVDVLVIGGGAGGLLVASCAKGKVAVIEKEDRVGKKILLTGNGRCNLSNLDLDSKYYSDSRFYEKINSKYGKRLDKFFDSLGLFTRADGAGRVYPFSNSASSVLDVLRFKAEENATFYTGREALKIIPKEDKYIVQTQSEAFLASKVIYACGGGKHALLSSLGLKITKTSPMLCPIETETDIIKGLDGVRVNALISLFQNGDEVYREAGEILFRKYGLSGVAVFNCSSFIARQKIKNKEFEADGFSVKLNLLHGLDLDRVKDELTKRIEKGVTGDRLLVGVLHRKVAECVLKGIGVYPDTRVSIKDLDKVWANLTEFKLKVKDLRCEGAQVTSGGVDLSELTDSLESKKLKNLYVIGESLNMDGLCGGYNLHWAFLSAIAVTD